MKYNNMGGRGNKGTIDQTFDFLVNSRDLNFYKFAIPSFNQPSKSVLDFKKKNIY